MTNYDIAREAAEKVGSHYGMPGPSKAFCHRVIFNAIADATAQKDEEIARLRAALGDPVLTEPVTTVPE